VPVAQDVPTERDIPQIKALAEFLGQATLVGAHGETQDIPEPVYQVLRRIVPLMAQGTAIAVVPMRHEVTTQQAADLLTISRPSLIKLLNAQALPYERSQGGHRRIRFARMCWPINSGVAKRGVLPWRTWPAWGRAIARTMRTTRICCLALMATRRAPTAPGRPLCSRLAHQQGTVVAIVPWRLLAL